MDQCKSHYPWLIQFAVSPFSFASVITGMEFGDSNSWGTNNRYRTTYTYFARLNNKWKGYMTFINYQFEKLNEQESSYRDSNTNTMTAEIKKIWTDIEAWVKGGLIYKEAIADENGHLAELSFNYDLFPNFELHLKNSYEGYNLNNKTDQIKLGGGLISSCHCHLVWNFKIP